MLNYLKSLRLMLLTCVVAGSILSVLAPYGTHTLGLPLRLVYWIGLCVLGGMTIALTEVGLAKRTLRLRPFQLAIARSVTSSLAVFVILAGLQIAASGMPPIAELLQLLFYVWVIAFTISLVGMLADRRSAPENTPKRPALYERLKPKLRQADIYALAAEDHYVRIITSKGEDLILMRLSDAIKEADPLPGLSPHRSWWVAEQGVAKAGTKEITLHTGQTVPVSRNGGKTVKAAGWV